ncbi:hypothetical protein V2J09_005084 [Rumex salicifolius]
MLVYILPKAPILLSLITILMIHQNTTAAVAQPDFIRTRCMNTSGDYTTGDAYNTSLDLLLKELTKKSSSSTSAYSETEKPDKVYGLYYCRGDLDASTCNTCVETASKKVITDCLANKDAIIWYQQCTLRYYTNNSVAFLEDDGKSVGQKSGDPVSDPNQMIVELTLAMNPLINKTAYGSSFPGYSTGEVNITSLQTLHCLTQCSPFITANRCDKCLKGLLKEVVSSYVNLTWVMLLNPSCQLRYDFLPFYKVSSTTLSAQSPGSSPNSVPVHNNAPTPDLTKGKNAMYYVIRVVVPVAVVALLLAGICLCQRRRLLALMNYGANQEEGND